MFRSTRRHFITGLSLLVGAIIFSNIAVHGVTAQTIPTRTPTPVGGPPTATRDAGDPGSDPTAPPTSTSRSQQPTATTTPLRLTSTPEGGQFATAEPCSTDVTARSLAAGLNVRSGPGLDYEVVGTLLAREVRPVVGRSSQGAWWQIILSNGVTGWVSDDLVSISGYIGQVPIVDPPLLDEMTVTPGTPWSPTPRPECTAPATPTATRRLTSTATASAPGSAAGEETTPNVEAPAGTATSVLSTATATVEAPPSELPPTAAPLPGEDESRERSGMLWIPMAGVGLILAAAVVFLARRWRG